LNPSSGSTKSGVRGGSAFVAYAATDFDTMKAKSRLTMSIEYWPLRKSCRPPWILLPVKILPSSGTGLLSSRTQSLQTSVKELVEKGQNYDKSGSLLDEHPRPRAGRVHAANRYPYRMSVQS
jgi:hypothetical protein